MPERREGEARGLRPLADLGSGGVRDRGVMTTKYTNHTKEERGPAVARLVCHSPRE